MAELIRYLVCASKVRRREVPAAVGGAGLTLREPAGAGCLESLRSAHLLCVCSKPSVIKSS